MEFIVALSQNGVIGKSDTNDLPWNIPEDLSHFYKLSKGHIVIMGNNTYNSLPNGLVMLKNRINIVITSKPEKYSNNILDLYFTNLYDFWILLEKIDTPNKTKFVIGGKEIYNLFYPYCNKIHMTIIYKNYDGDVMFPLTTEELGTAVEHSPIYYSCIQNTPYQFITYQIQHNIVSV